MKASHWRRLAEHQREGHSYDPSISPRSMSVATVDKFNGFNDVAIQQLQREIDDLKTANFDSETTKKEIKEYETKIRALVEDAQADTHLQRTLREKILLEVAKVRTKIKNQQKRLAALDAEHKNFSLETLNVEAVAKNRQQGFARSTDLLKDSTLNCNNLRQEADRLRKLSEAFFNQKSALATKLAATEERVDDRLAFFRNLKEAVAQTEDRLEALLREKSALEEQRAGLEKSNKSTEQKINEVENEINGLLLDVNNAGKELQKNKLEAFTMKNEVIIREARLGKKTATLAELDEKIADLSSRFAEEKTKLDKKEAFLAHLKAQEEEKLIAIEAKRKKTLGLKDRLAVMDKLTQRILEEMKAYVKTDKSIIDSLQLGYFDRSGPFVPDATFAKALSVQSK